MAGSAHVAKPLRVLLSEGNSTSAREAITILGLSGHLVEVCDPSPYCLARFSRFVSKFHRCPGLRDDPAGFLRFVEELLAARHFDVLLPTHEQGFLFARVRQRLEVRVGLALPSFDSYRTAHSKAGFIPAERPYLASYRIRAVCGDWMVVEAVLYEPVSNQRTGNFLRNSAKNRLPADW